METDSTPTITFNSKRWAYLKYFTERDSPLSKPDFMPSIGNLEFLQNGCRILVVGAGGLGCELLKNLAMLGFRDIHVIDMDTVELSNLNRQFLFRRSDIGASKAEIAAKFVNKRVPTAFVTPHFAQIQDFDSAFYRQFNIILCGLDSILARRWINGMLFQILGEDDKTDMGALIPLIDGGTEGFKGNARIILPSLTACIDCTLDLYPPQITYPLCTIANAPRLPEHCIEYVKIIQWDKENPFQVALDCDDPIHVSWIYEKSMERANNYNITGVTYRLVQGVIKNIIPAVASTNAVIAAASAHEAFKLATGCYEVMSNFIVFNDAEGIYTYTYPAEKTEDCLVCSNKPIYLEIENPDTTTLEDLIKELKESRRFQMKNPALQTFLNGKLKTLYMSTVKDIEQRTRSNLTLSISELFLNDGQILDVTDPTSPNPIEIILKFKENKAELKNM